MKVLPMLDHVMFWGARFFTASLLIIFALPLAMDALGFVFFSLDFFMTGDWDFHPSHGMKEELLRFAYALFLYSCVWLLPNKAARICLGLISGIFCVGFAIATLVIAMDYLESLHNDEGFLFAGLLLLLVSLVGFIGFTSTTWISIRMSGTAAPSDSTRPIILHP